MASVMGGTQSLHTNSLDEALGLPTKFSARIARNTQLVLQEESHICNVGDPWGGSYLMESLTEELYKESKKIIEEVEGLGGMTKAIMTGMPKYRIEESAAKKQARIDAGTDVIVGVNKYKLGKEDPIEVRQVDNKEVRIKQIDRINATKAKRNNEKVKQLLQKLTDACKDTKENLLEIAVDCAKERATIGEISDAMEATFGRYKPTTTVVKGAFKMESEKNEKGKSEIQSTIKKVKDFSKRKGRNPRIYIAKMGQDGHDRGSKVIASGFADLGFDVDVGSLFQTPAEAARVAIDNDVHVVGVSSLAAGHKTLVPELINELKKQGGENIVVVAGGVIPPIDYDFLYSKGVKCIFGPGSRVIDSANKVLEQLN
jgi:methylmalonyl-CoA mutase